MAGLSAGWLGLTRERLMGSTMVVKLAAETKIEEKVEM